MVKILLITHRIPYPPNKGEKIRAYQMIQNLKKLGHKVTCAFPIEQDIDFSYAQQLKNMCDRVIHPDIVQSRFKKYCHGIKTLLCDTPLTKGLGFDYTLYDKLKQDAMNYDIVIFFSSVSYYYKSAIDYKIAICDFVDMDSYKWREYAQHSFFPMSYIYNREADLMAKLERKIARYVHQSLFVTDNEKNLFLSENHDIDFKNSIDSLECSVDVTRFNSDFNYLNPFLNEHKNNLNFVMTGAMDYKPNYDGAIFFITQVLPYIQQQTDKKIGFYCVGRNPVKKLRHHHNPDKNIVITGSVDDVRPYINHAFAAVAPLFIGRGIQNKVLEAMAMGKVCFVSQNAFEGVDAVDNEHLIICPDMQSWRDKIINAIENTDSLITIGHNATQHIQKRYTALSVQEKLNMILNKLIISYGMSV